MNAARPPRGFSTVLLVAAVYFVMGIGFAALAARSGTGAVRTVWRLGAWLASFAVFAVQVGYQHARHRLAPAANARRAALAVAVAGFALAVSATIHGRTDPSHQHLRVLAMLLWPLAGGLPAFAAAWVLAAVLARLRRSG